jgi:hypothetical protein
MMMQRGLKFRDEGAEGQTRLKWMQHAEFEAFWDAERKAIWIKLLPVH